MQEIRAVEDDIVYHDPDTIEGFLGAEDDRAWYERQVEVFHVCWLKWEDERLFVSGGGGVAGADFGMRINSLQILCGRFVRVFISDNLSIATVVICAGLVWRPQGRREFWFQPAHASLVDDEMLGG